MEKNSNKLTPNQQIILALGICVLGIVAAVVFAITHVEATVSIAVIGLFGTIGTGLLIKSKSDDTKSK